MRVAGVVQGVGFRPFVHTLAARHGLTGFVLNDEHGVVIEAEGDAVALGTIHGGARRRRACAGAGGGCHRCALAPRGERTFAIAPSRGRRGPALVPPDAATCDDCLRELLDPSDRRHRHPFITCTHCGPRFTIVRDVPYDRRNTTMAGFPLCRDCRREYEDPADRRFHAEAIACPACGPELSMALEEAVALLRAGEILAVKGLGGWHLACDATDDIALSRLRARKHRDAKPFAIMTSDPGAIAETRPDELALMQSAARPIVLVRRRSGVPVADAVTCGGPWLGVMLPYTPLHHLLAHDVGRPLVMTSGNRTDEPIAVDDHEAHDRLAGIADAFLGHDRPIHRRCEDSVVRAGFPIRRSRGMVPGPMPLPVAASRALVASGAELKSTFCVAGGHSAHLSPTSGTSTPRRPCGPSSPICGSTGDAWTCSPRTSSPTTCIRTTSRPGGRWSRTPSRSRCSTTMRTPPPAWPSTA